MGNTFQVIVGNVGTVHTGRCHATAHRVFRAYADISRLGHGRAGGEDVFLLCESDDPVFGPRQPIAEYIPALDTETE